MCIEALTENVVCLKRPIYNIRVQEFSAVTFLPVTGILYLVPRYHMTSDLVPPRVPYHCVWHLHNGDLVPSMYITGDLVPHITAYKLKNCTAGIWYPPRYMVPCMGAPYYLHGIWYLQIHILAEWVKVYCHCWLMEREDMLVSYRDYIFQRRLGLKTAHSFAVCETDIVL